MDISKYAKEALNWFEFTGTRHPELRENIWVTKRDHPEWVTDLVYAAHEHGNVLPDDYVYEYVVDALDYLSDEDNDPDDYYPEADVYYSDLLNWLASNVNRVSYVDDAKKEFGDGCDTMTLIGYGQVEEKREVFGAVREWIEANTEEFGPLDDEEKTDDGDDNYDEITGTIFDDSDEPERL